MTRPLSQVKLYKLSKRRSCFSLHKYFIKILFSKSVRQLNSTLSTSKLNQFLVEQDIASFPRVIFQKKLFNLSIEIHERIKDAHPLSHEHEIFYNRVRKALASTKGKYSKVSWQAILKPEILKYIKTKSEIYEYIESILGKEEYPDTGMHGDFNPNNVLIDRDQNFWIVDWENYGEDGCFLWDIYFFYGNWKRSTPRPPEDIISIYNHAKKSDIEIQEMLLIYALIKLRSDLQRHNRIKEIALENFFQRVSTIIGLC